MADYSVGTWDELHDGSEASHALMICFDIMFPEKYCFVVNLVCFLSPSLRVFCVPECYQKGVKCSTALKVFFQLTIDLSGENRQSKGVHDQRGTVFKVCSFHFRLEV